MTKERTTYHRIEGIERRIDEAYRVALDTLTIGVALKFPGAISLQCTKTEWDELREKLNMVEWKPKFAVY